MSYYPKDGHGIDPVAVYYYQTASGRCPFKDWLDSLDMDVQSAVDSRLTRVRRGLFGDFRYLGAGVYELKFHAGAGLRIYYGRDGEAVVILLEAGTKRGQSSDIETARRFWQDYSRRARK